MTELPAHKRGDFGNTIYGPARLRLALRVRDALNRTGFTWFLDAGTLLGAYRNGHVIPHDDDFDLAVYIPDFDAARDLPALQAAVRLGDPYAARIVTSYAHKVEVFDRHSTRFTLPPDYGKADFHAVTVDLQVMTDASDGDTLYLHDLLTRVRVPRDCIAPPGEIVCEGERFNCPHDVKGFLEAVYGYLGLDARFDPDSGKYVRV
ncbi:MAG: LicD family protein [Myxococcales bacterium]|nr:LicD family protein [Myxococcales bacterium]